MPDVLFTAAAGRAGEGVAAVEHLSALCVTPLMATAIRYALCAEEAVAVVVSTGKRVNYLSFAKNDSAPSWVT